MLLFFLSPRQVYRGIDVESGRMVAVKEVALDMVLYCCCVSVEYVSIGDRVYKCVCVCVCVFVCLFVCFRWT